MNQEWCLASVTKRIVSDYIGWSRKLLFLKKVNMWFFFSLGISWFKLRFWVRNNEVSIKNMKNNSWIGTYPLSKSSASVSFIEAWHAEMLVSLISNSNYLQLCVKVWSNDWLWSSWNDSLLTISWKLNGWHSVLKNDYRTWHPKYIGCFVICSFGSHFKLWVSLPDVLSSNEFV